jgi:hypothetical protein
MNAALVVGDIPGAGVVTNVISSATGWAWDKVADGIAGWVLGAVEHFVTGVVNFLQTAAAPDLHDVWFAGAGSPFATVRTIAAALLAVFALLAVIQGLLRGDPGAMLHRVVVGLPAAVLAIVVTIAVSTQLLELTDALSAAVLQPSGAPAISFLSGFGKAATTATSGFAAVVVGAAAVLAGLALWAELLVRSALVYLLVALSPLAFAASVWPSARSTARRLIELLVAVIVSKLAIAIALSVGVAALGGAGSAADPSAGAGTQAAAGLGTLIVGTAILALAAFAPFVVLRLMPVAEAAIVAQGISRSPLRAAQTAVYTASTVGRLAGGPAATGGMSAAGAAGGATTSTAPGGATRGAAPFSTSTAAPETAQPGERPPGGSGRDDRPAPASSDASPHRPPPTAAAPNDGGNRARPATPAPPRPNPTTTSAAPTPAPPRPAPPRPTRRPQEGLT